MIQREVQDSENVRWTGDRNRTAHWAYVLQTRPGEPNWDSLPGVGLSVPEMLEGTEAPQAPEV